MSNIIKLSYQDKEIILIATAHVSSESVNDVKNTIINEQPDAICVELDQDRYHSLTNPENWQNLDIQQIIKQKKVGYLLVNLILASFQKRIAKDLDTTAGQEMVEGINLAKQYNIPLILADRSIKTTLLRIWRYLSFWEKFKLMFSLISSVFDDQQISLQEVEDLKTQDMLEQALKEISQQFPNIKKVLVDERDQYLTYKIQNAPGNKIVAIVGAAHTIGIQQLLNKPQTINDIDDIPLAKISGKIIGWSIPIIILVMLISSFILNPSFGTNQLLTWILYNGTASALGCALLLAHPLTIIASFFIAPLTSLTPIIGAGWFSALIEAILRKPKVRDFQELAVDTTTLKGFFKNRVSRILLIFFFSNLFSAIATFISGFDIFGSLIDKL